MLAPCGLLTTPSPACALVFPPPTELTPRVATDRLVSQRNPTTVAYATMNSLRRMASAQEIADRRGERVLDYDPRMVRYPGWDSVYDD